MGLIYLLVLYRFFQYYRHVLLPPDLGKAGGPIRAIQNPLPCLLFHSDSIHRKRPAGGTHVVAFRRPNGPHVLSGDVGAPGFPTIFFFSAERRYARRAMIRLCFRAFMCWMRILL